MTAAAKPLPAHLSERYHAWKATEFVQKSAQYRKLADEGQSPGTMIISCCDSRVSATTVFGAEAGELFVHRNIAALVPEFSANKDFHGTSAAIEYAVQHLGVASIAVIGHSQCGGVAACHDIVAGDAPQLDEDNSFIGSWLRILKGDAAEVTGETRADRVAKLEKLAVIRGVTNLMSFPYVGEAVEAGTLTIHGLWMDVGAGTLHQFDATSGEFIEV